MKHDTLQRILKRTRRRVVLTSGVQRAGVGLVFGAIGGLALVGFDRVFDAGWPWWIPAGACALGAVGGFLSSVLRPPAADEMAVLLDRALGLKDRIGTAEAIDRGRVRADAVAELVKRDAARVAAGITPSSIIPWRFGRPWAVAAMLVGAVAATNAFLPSLAWSRTPADRLTPEQAAELDQAQKDVASTIARFSEPAARESDTPIDERSREQYDRLADLAKQLQAPQNDPNAFRESRDQAASTLNQLAEEKQREAERTREATRRLTEKFDRLTPPTERPPTGELERALKDGDYRKAAQLLEQLDRAVNEMSPTERKAAAERLREIADSLRETTPGEARSADGSAGEATAANDAEQRRRLREELRRQGVNETTIDELINRNEPITPRDLVGEGVDPETARDLAREAEEARQNEQAREQADRTGRELAERFDRLADEVESPPAPRPGQPDEPADGEESSNDARDEQPDGNAPPDQRGDVIEPDGKPQDTGEKSRDQNQSQQQQDRPNEGARDASTQQNRQQGAEEPPRNQQQQQGDGQKTSPPPSQEQQQQKQDSGESTQGEQQREQRDGESSQQQQQQQQGAPGQSGTEPGQTKQPGRQGAQETSRTEQQHRQGEAREENRSGDPNQQGAADQQSRGEEVDRNSDQSGAEQGGKQPGEQSGQRQVGEEQTGQDESKPGGAQGAPPDSPESPGTARDGQEQQQSDGGTDSPEFNPENLPSAEELKKMLDEIERRRESGEQSAQDAERMRDAAREIAEKLTPEERQRLQEWAEQMQRELGREQPSSPDQLDEARSAETTGADRPGGGDGAGTEHGIGAGGNETNRNPNRLNTTEGEILDLRGEESTDRTLAEIFDGRRPDAPTSTDRAIPGVVARDARRAAEQAVNNATIHRRYHELIRRYFDKLPETLDEASKGTHGEGAKSGESSSSSSSSGEAAQEGGSSR